MTLEPKWEPKARFLRGQIFSGKKGFGTVPRRSRRFQELRERGRGVPIRILRSSRLRSLEAGGWELRRLGSSLEVQKFRIGVSSLEVQKFRRGVKRNWSLQPLKKRGGAYTWAGGVISLIRDFPYSHKFTCTAEGGRGFGRQRK